MMKRAGKSAGEDFGDNRVPGKGQYEVRKGLTTETELDNQPDLAHADRRPMMIKFKHTDSL